MKKLDILYEDKSIICVNKKSGILTVSNSKENVATLYHEVREYLHKKNQKVFIVHRLDKDTCGIVLFAKNPHAQKILQQNWDNVIRNYKAIVYGKMPKKHDEVTVYLKETKTLLSYVTLDKQKGQKAITSYDVIKENDNYSLLDINIKTGKKNQIRVTLSSLNHPIVGDKKYGIKKENHSNMALCANEIIFMHPENNQKMHLTLNMPKFMEMFM